jgi:hypothetical protein
MCDAACSGRLDVLQWLVEHYPDQSRDDLMEIATWEGHLDVVQYFDKSTKQRASKWRLGAAATLERSSGVTGVLSWLWILLVCVPDPGASSDKRVPAACSKVRGEPRREREA